MQPQWYSLLWFHHRRVDSIWVRIIKDCLSFSRRENTSCKYPQYPRPVHVLLRCRLRSLVSLFSRVNTFPAPIIPLPLEEKPEKLEGAIESCPRLPSPPDFPTPLLLSFLLSLLPPFSLRLIVRHACTCVPFYRARLKGCHPSFFPIFFLSRSFPSSSLLSRHSVRATEQTSHFETNEEEEESFLGYAFSFAVVVVSPLLWARKR